MVIFRFLASKFKIANLDSIAIPEEDVLVAGDDLSELDLLAEFSLARIKVSGGSRGCRGGRLTEGAANGVYDYSMTKEWINNMLLSKAGG